MRHALKQKPRRPVDVARVIDDQARFLRSWLEKPLVTGAVAPSSPELAAMMASYLDPARPGVVVELGPGTGPVTEAILARGFAPERLVLVEYNPEFVDLLRNRFPGVTVVQGDAYAMRETVKGIIDQPVNGVVSSLPLFTKPVEQRLGLVNDAFDMGEPGLPFIQFTYAVVSPVPQGVLPGMTAEVSKRIWKNLPPARVWVYRRP